MIATKNVQSFIGGKFRDSRAQKVDPIPNPATGQTIASLPHSTKEEINEAVEAAKKAFPAWSETPVPERAQVILRGLHDQGLTIALDDFGTGYSSLSRLRSLPIEVLKIDQSFIHDVEHDRSARSVVRALIQLAHSLGMVPLAEGVETRGQLEYLAERGCTLGQGFYFSRPVPARDITIDLVERPVPSVAAEG